MIPDNAVEISKGLFAVGPSLFLKSHSALIFGDVHVGYEEMLNREGFLIPRFHIREVLKIINPIVESLSPEMIVINGDLKHEFGTIYDQEWRDTLKLIDFLSEKVSRKSLSGKTGLVLVRGNHDTILGPIAAKRNIRVVDSLVIGRNLILHGHKLPDELGEDSSEFASSEFRNCDRIIISHEHPSVTLSKGSRREKFKCFLKCSFRNKELIVLPSLNPLVEGSDVTLERPMSPFIDSYDPCQLWVLSDKNEILPFGTVSSLLEELKRLS